MSMRLQITEYIERSNTVMEQVGKRAILKATGELCTVKKAENDNTGTKYLIHLDRMPPTVKVVVFEKNLVIIGEVQY